MALNRITSSFSHGQEQAQRSAKANIDLMLKYKKVFQHIKGGDQYLTIVQDLSRSKEKYTPNQLSLINEKIYEKFMKGLGKYLGDEKITGATTKHDTKFGMRF